MPFSVLEAGECDYIYILDLYFSKVPSEALEKDNFHLCPSTHVKGGLLWFFSVPIGCNKLLLWLNKCVLLEVSKVIKATIVFVLMALLQCIDTIYQRR